MLGAYWEPLENGKSGPACVHRVQALPQLDEHLRRKAEIPCRVLRDEHALQLPDVDRVDSLATELATQHRRMIAADSARVRAQRAAAAIAARLTVANVGARIEKPPWRRRALGQVTVIGSAAEGVAIGVAVGSPLGAVAGAALGAAVGSMGH